MFEGYSVYSKDRRMRDYTDYIREKAFDLGMLSINTNEPVTFKPVLEETRSQQDYYRIIYYLQQSNILNYDCIQTIIKLIKHREPISTREWYMGVYDVVRESKVIPVFCSWYHSGFLGRFTTPLSMYRLTLINSLNLFKRNRDYCDSDKQFNHDITWIQSPKEITTIQNYKFSQCHYERILNHNPIIYPIKYNWVRDCYGDWVREKKLRSYIPYAIKWSINFKFPNQFIEIKRRNITKKRNIPLHKNSPWLRIECGNRCYYEHKDTHKKQRDITEEGFYDIHITDIYYFDTQYPILII